MTKEITIIVTSPIECTDEQFEEWAKYSLGYVGGMSIENPLHEYDLQVSDINIS